jgi:hypothetical protein
MSSAWRLDRRTFLRGVGVSMALPMLDAMQPGIARAAATGEPPVRMAFLYVPNGVNMATWTPEAEGKLDKLPEALQPLAGVKDHVTVLTGLAQEKAESNGDGAGDHARSVATFLTGAQARKTAGKDIHVGVSVDQVAAQQIGAATRLPSLELGTERGRMAGSCDSGYSCAYSSNMSWRTPNTPVPKETNPRSVFDRLLGIEEVKSNADAQQAKKYDQSVLDFVLEDAQDLKRRLGQTDRRKLDEYLDSVRELEARIARAPGEGNREADELDPNMLRPKGVPGDYGEHLRLMADLLALGFRLDVTRVGSFMMADAGSNRSYRNIDVPDGHHSLSHHGNNKDKLTKIAKINRFHVEQFAYLLKKLSDMPEGAGSLLDNTMLVYGSGIGDGNRHNHNDLPILLAGRGGGLIQPGRHVRYARDTPLMNLYLAMLQRMNVKVDQLGDSTGVLGGLSGKA